MSEFKHGDLVRLSKAGVKHVKKTYAEDMDTSARRYYPLDGDVGRVAYQDNDDQYYVEWNEYADYLIGEHIIAEHESEFPAKIPAYKVRIGDVIKDSAGKKFTVRLIEDYGDEPKVLYFTGPMVNDKWESYTSDADIKATKKIKVFSREYK